MWKKMFGKLLAFLNPKGIMPNQDYTNRENLKGIWFLLNASVFLCLFSIGGQMIFGKTETFPSTIMLLVVVLICYSFFFFRHKDGLYSVLAAVYLISGLIGFTAVMADTLFTTGQYAITSLVYLFLIPQLILDLPWRIFLLEGGLTAVFVGTAFSADQGPILEMNVIRVIIVATLSLILSTSRVFRVIRLLNRNTTIQKVAEHDPLTAVYNRAGGRMLIQNLIINGQSGTMVIMDIDNFKHVNDAFGHQTGDRVLKEVGAHLLDSFRNSDVVMRLGGDEFVIYAVGMVDRTYVEQKMDDVCKGMHNIILDPATGEHLTISMGCVVNDGSYPDLDAMYHVADKVLYKTKAAGKDGFQLLSVSYHEEGEKTDPPMPTDKGETPLAAG